MGESWAPVPYCFESPQFQRKTPASGLIKLLSIRKLRIRLVLGKFKPLTREVLHTRPQKPRRQSLRWNEGSACARWALATPVSSLPATLVPQGKNPPLFWNHLLFPTEGLALACCSTRPAESRRGKYRGWEIIAAAARKLGRVLCKHWWNLQRGRCLKSRMSAKPLGFDLLYEEVVAKKGEKLRSLCDFFSNLCLNIDGYAPLVTSR